MRERLYMERERVRERDTEIVGGRAHGRERERESAGGRNM